MGRGLSAAVAVAATASLAFAVAASASSNGNGRSVLHGAKPQWTAAATPTASVPAAQQLKIKVWLQPRNAAQLAALAQAVSDPTSGQYHQFISADQYRSTFAPTGAQVSQVSSWLLKAGLKVASVGPDNHFIAASGTAAAIASAFGTKLSQYDVAGGTERAPSAEVSVPDAVGSLVAAVSGLSTLGHRAEPQDLGAPAGYVNGTPCSSYYGEKAASNVPKFDHHTLPYAVCGYVPSQLRSAYGVAGSGLSGDGQTVAITDAFDASTLQSDANTYATAHGDPAFAAGQFADNSVADDPSRVADCGGNGWYGEQTLDIEAVHGMAPGAKVLYHGAASCYDDDLMAQLAQVVADNKASIVSNSWGEPTVVANVPGCTPDAPCLTIDQSLVDAYETIFKQGAVQGIGFYFSSGDNGDEYDTWGYAHPDYPAGDPWVTAVGGTSLGIGRDGSRQFETGWGTAKWVLDSTGTDWQVQFPFLYGAGGGYSQIFDEPWYQKPVVASPTGGRAVPDIAMDADPTTGMLVGETQSFPLDSRYGPAGVHYGEYRIGGTSLASPLLAGVQAAVQQGVGVRIGFANPLIYLLESSRHGSKLFYDPTGKQPDAGNVRADYRNGMNADNGMLFSVRTFNQDSSLTTDKGWDTVTGVGTITSNYVGVAAAFRR